MKLWTMITIGFPFLLIGMYIGRFQKMKTRNDQLWQCCSLGPGPGSAAETLPGSSHGINRIIVPYLPVMKEFVAYHLLQAPKLQRFLKLLMGRGHLDGRPRTQEEYARLETFHEDIEFMKSGMAFGGKSTKMKDSPFFAENFYIFITDPTDENVVVTTRLSFTGINGSTIVPWFTFTMDGQTEWSLPDAFEGLALSREQGSQSIMAHVPELGTLQFECVTPMREWNVKYEGQVVSSSLVAETSNHRNAKKWAHVTAEFNLNLTPNNVFFYQLDWNELATSRAMAGKTWDDSFWNDLRAQNQERYSSKSIATTGSLNLSPALSMGNDDQGSKDESHMHSVSKIYHNLVSSRDHNFGIRNWGYIHHYVWWPPLSFHSPLVVPNVGKFHSMTGSMVEYGNTFKDLIVGGLSSDDLNETSSSFSAATPMRYFASEWYTAAPQTGVPIGKNLVPGSFEFFISFHHSTYVMRIQITRGTTHGLWAHSFMLADNTFEVHEAQALWQIDVFKASEVFHANVRNKVNDNDSHHKVSVENCSVVGSARGHGLLEFGANLRGHDRRV